MNNLFSNTKNNKKSKGKTKNLFESAERMGNSAPMGEKMAEWTPVLEQTQRAQKKVERLNHLANQERELFNQETQKLKTEVKALQEEIKSFAQKTEEISQEVQSASSQNIPEASQYQVNFLQRLRTLIINFRKNVSEASHWMEELFSRQKKRKNFWARFSDKKKGGSQFLLSGESYASRSAG